MTIKEAKAIDMVAYLSTMGYEPTRVYGANYWYLSPFRSEKAASFRINRKLNRWYDFGEGKGGNLLDFVLLLDGGTIPEALQKLAGNIPQASEPTASEKPIPVIEILSTHLISSFALVRYLDNRRIPATIADTWLKEIRYRNGYKTYYALGFKNDAGGYELRSPNFKGSSSPKSPSLIRNNSNALAVFEGFFDFLSYCTMCQYQPAPKRDFLVLNSTSFFEKQLPNMQAYEYIHLYLDNDTTGNKYTKLSLDLNAQKFIDERPLYQPHNDLNEWLVEIGKAPKPAT